MKRIAKKSTIGAVLLCMLSSALHARTFGEFKPVSGGVQIKGKSVIINFSLSKENAEYLDATYVKKNDEYEARGSGIGIRVVFPGCMSLGIAPKIRYDGYTRLTSDYKEKNFNALGVYVQEAKTDTYLKDLHSGVLVKESEYVMTPNDLAIRSTALGRGMPIVRLYSSSGYDTVIQNSQQLPYGYMYSIELILNKNIPIDQEVQVSFHREKSGSVVNIGKMAELGLGELTFTNNSFKDHMLTLGEAVVEGGRFGAKGVFVAFAFSESLNVVYKVRRFFSNSQYSTVPNTTYTFDTFKVQSDGTGTLCWNGDIIKVNQGAVCSDPSAKIQGSEEYPSPVMQYPEPIGPVLPTVDSGSGSGSSNDTGTVARQQDEDISIVSFNIGFKGQEKYFHSMDVKMNPGQFMTIEGELKIKAKEVKADNVDIDYRIDKGRKDFDKDDKQIDEDKVDIPANLTIVKHMGATTVKLSNNAKYVTVTGPKGSKTVYVENGVAKFYIFIDADSANDKDMSSEKSEHREYGVVRVHVDKPRNFLPSNSNGAVPISRYTYRIYSYFNHNPAAFVGSNNNDWYRAGTTFLGFPTANYPDVKPVLTCWTDKGHAYGINEVDFAVQPVCKGAKEVVFYAYDKPGEGRMEVPIMLRNNPTQSVILANGLADAESLKSNHGFRYSGRSIYAPKYRTLPVQDVQVGTGNDVTVTATNGGDVSSDYKNSSCYKAGYETKAECMKMLDIILD